MALGTLFPLSQLLSEGPLGVFQPEHVHMVMRLTQCRAVTWVAAVT